MDRMDGVNSDNISVLANNMASLVGLGETSHAIMDSDAADDRFKYP